MRSEKQTGGFTLIELLVVVLVIGILVTVSLPQYLKVVEKGRAAEVFRYLSDARKAQDRYALGRPGFAADLNSLDIPTPSFRYFDNNVTISNGSQAQGWTATFTRLGAPQAPAQYSSSYQITFNSSNISFGSNDPNVTNDLLPTQ
jgi:prepilin-type N-terminal cleavage/methylation domain-containing protein